MGHFPPTLESRQQGGEEKKKLWHRFTEPLTHSYWWTDSNASSLVDRLRRFLIGGQTRTVPHWWTDSWQFPPSQFQRGSQPSAPWVVQAVQARLFRKSMAVHLILSWRRNPPSRSALDSLCSILRPLRPPPIPRLPSSQMASISHHRHQMWGTDLVSRGFGIRTHWIEECGQKRGAILFGKKSKWGEAGVGGIGWCRGATGGLGWCRVV